MTDKRQEVQERHTGLGGSLLLQRTAPQPSTVVSTPLQIAEQPEHADVPPEPEPKTEVKKPQELRDRCTLYLDREVNAQLDFVARIERRQRSEIVAEILRGNLPKYSVNKE